MLNEPSAWKTFILDRGIKQTAFELDLTKEMVRLWVNNLNLPVGKKLRILVSIAKRELSEDEFKAFMESLSKDIFGIEVPVAHAVNE